MFLFLLCITAVLEIVSSEKCPVKCVVTAPYNINDPLTVLAVDKAVREAQACYEYKLSYMIEHLSSYPYQWQVREAMNDFMDVYCVEPFFKGFIGITGTGELYTNRTEVKELYKNVALTPGTHVPFNVNFYNVIITIPEESQVNYNSLYANITAFNRHYLRVSTFTTNTTTNTTTETIDLWVVLGHYVNEWRIDRYGNVCLSAFSDFTNFIASVPQHTIVAIPWDIKM